LPFDISDIDIEKMVAMTCGVKFFHLIKQQEEMKTGVKRQNKAAGAQTYNNRRYILYNNL
jgi:hypothetical protein